MTDFTKRFYDNLQTRPQFTKDELARVKQQEQNQIFHGRRKMVYMPIIERRPDFWQIDTTFYPLKGKKRAIFTAINVNTKQGFIAPYSGASPTSQQSIQFLQRLTMEFPVKNIGADNGSEFVAKAVQTFLESKGIKAYYYSPYDSKEKAVIERFNSTVKNFLNKVAYSIDSNWVNYTDKIMDTYNNIRHSSTGKAPNDMTERDIQEYIAKQSLKSLEYRNYLQKFQPGTRVRVYREANPDLTNKQKQAEKQFAKKDYPSWSKTIYTVEKVDGFKVLLQGLTERFSPRDLLIVSEVETHEPIQQPATKQQARKTRRIGQALAELDQAPRKTGERTTRSKGFAPELFKIEKIIERKVVDGRPKFRVKWRGMPNSSSTWEDATRFVQTGQQKLLHNYLDREPLSKDELI